MPNSDHKGLKQITHSYILRVIVVFVQLLYLRIAPQNNSILVFENENDEWQLAVSPWRLLPSE